MPDEETVAIVVRWVEVDVHFVFLVVDDVRWRRRWWWTESKKGEPTVWLSGDWQRAARTGASASHSER